MYKARSFPRLDRTYEVREDHLLVKPFFGLAFTENIKFDKATVNHRRRLLLGDVEVAISGGGGTVCKNLLWPKALADVLREEQLKKHSGNQAHPEKELSNSDSTQGRSGIESVNPKEWQKIKGLEIKQAPLKPISNDKLENTFSYQLASHGSMSFEPIGGQLEFKKGDKFLLLCPHNTRNKWKMSLRAPADLTISINTGGTPHHRQKLIYSDVDIGRYFSEVDEIANNLSKFLPYLWDDFVGENEAAFLLEMSEKRFYLWPPRKTRERESYVSRLLSVRKRCLESEEEVCRLVSELIDLENSHFESEHVSFDRELMLESIHSKKRINEWRSRITGD